MSTALWSTQLGVESTYGVAVTADKKIAALSITPTLNIERDSREPVGDKFARLLGSTRKWYSASYEGVMCTRALPYVLSSLLKEVAPTLVSTSLAYKWEYLPDPNGAEAFKSYTFNSGYGSDAVEATGVAFQSLTIEFSRRRNVFTMSGDIIGRDATSTSMDTLSSVIETNPLLASQVNIYMADTYAGLSSGHLSNVLSGTIEISTRYADVWYVDSSQSGFAKLVDVHAPVTISLMFEATAANLALLDSLASGARKFIRVEAVGGLIEATSYHTFTFDMAGELGEVRRFEDSDGVYAFSVGLYGVQDDTLDTGGVFKATVITDVNAL